MKKHYRVYVVSDDPFCSGLIQFDAHSAVLCDLLPDCESTYGTLLVDGIVFSNPDGFHDLEEGWIN